MLPAASPPRLLDRLRAEIRTRHYSIRTEAAYVDWVRRFIHFHDKRHPRDMGAVQVAAFLSFLATQRQVAASTQNQAKSALLFLYRQVLGVDLPWLDEVGTGLRLLEGLRLRVKDVEFERRELIVCDGKGGKDRAVMLPATLVPVLRDQLLSGRVLWSADAQSGHAGVQMPDALERKYPQAGSSWGWSARRGARRHRAAGSPATPAPGR